MAEGKTARGSPELPQWEVTKVLMETKSGGRGKQCERLDERQSIPVVRLMHSCMSDLSFCCQPHAKALNSLGKCSERTPGYGSSTTHVWCEALEPWGGKGRNPLSLCPLIGL